MVYPRIESKVYERALKKMLDELFEDFKKQILSCVDLSELYQIEREVYESDLSDARKTELSWYIRARIGVISK